MNATRIPSGMFSQILTSARIVLGTMFICCAAYAMVIYAFAQVLSPDSAEGSLVRDARGVTVGSSLIAQGFRSPRYFHPRPSAVAYDASAAGGSNFSPTNHQLRARAESIIAQTPGGGVTAIPADLVTASGSGLDPHISLSAAEYQLHRVAAARGMSPDEVIDVMMRYTTQPTLAPEPLVNVFLVNLELDRTGK